MRAYTVVYKRNNLHQMVEKREKIRQDLSRPQAITAPPSQPTRQLNQPSRAGNATPAFKATAKSALLLKKPANRKAGGIKVSPREDPFRIRDCLIDVANDLEEKDKVQTTMLPTVDVKPTVTTRKLLRRTAVTAPTRRSADESLIPGNCTSFYSIRRYYEEEKDQLLVTWSPEERRKRTVSWILNNLKLPRFSIMRQKTTSAIFREFNRFKRQSIAEETIIKQTLPDIRVTDDLDKYLTTGQTR